MLKPTTINIKLLLVPIAIIWAIEVALCLIFPGMTAGNRVALLLITGAAVTATNWQPFAGKGAVYTMAVASLLLGAGVILNTWYFTTVLGGTPSDPVLINDDSFRWWNDALYHLNADEGQRTYPNHGFYGWILAGVLFVFGKTVGAALLWSMSLVLASLLTTGMLCHRITSDTRTCVAAMAATAAVCYWLTMGTLILKEAFLFLGMLVGVYALTCSKKRRLALLAVASAMLMLTRPGTILMLVLGLAMFGTDRRNIYWSLCGAAVCLIFWEIPNLISFTPDYAQVFDERNTGAFVYTAPNRMAFYNIVGDFSELPFYKKILWLPASAVVQFFIPFPWNFARDVPFGITEAYAHVAYPWYLFGAVFIYFLATNLRRYRSVIFRMSVWALICWVSPCLYTGGTVSRYGLPLVAIMSVAVAYTLIKNYKNRRFYTYLGIYCVILGVALIVAHHLQTSAAQ